MIIAETTVQVLSETLESLNEEAVPLGLRVSRIKTKVPAFHRILNAIIDSIFVRDEFMGQADVDHSWQCNQLVNKNQKSRDDLDEPGTQ